VATLLTGFLGGDDHREALLGKRDRDTVTRMSQQYERSSLVRSSIVTSVSLAAAALFAREQSAVAQARFGDKGQLAITGENLFGLQTERVGESVPNPMFPNTETTTTSNRFGFLYSQGTPTPHGPQVGAHYFIIPSLSLGGTLGYESRAGSQTRVQNNGVTVTNDTPNVSTFTFLPKVGYALMFRDKVGFWFRGGLGVFRVETSEANSPRKDSDTWWLLSLDALLVVSPVPNFGFYVGPQADISFSGTHSNTDNRGIETSWGSSYRDIGLGAGLVGYFDL
jgi:hypothetical protein